MKKCLLFLAVSIPTLVQVTRCEAALYATLETSMGKIVCLLFEKETPVTVSNFVGLADGTKEWIDPRTGQKTNRHFYDGLIFHRVIPKFMIQGGCPLGTGTGGPGYSFEDEIVTNLNFDKAGKLAMANGGPATNGSQFFITTVSAPWLNGKNTIFGEVVKGMDIVNTISNVPRGAADKPFTPVIIKKITISRDISQSISDGKNKNSLEDYFPLKVNVGYWQFHKIS